MLAINRIFQYLTGFIFITTKVKCEDIGLPNLVDGERVGLLDLVDGERVGLLDLVGGKRVCLPDLVDDNGDGIDLPEFSC